MKRLLLPLFLSLGLVLFVLQGQGPCLAAGLDQSLVARWSFTDGTIQGSPSFSGGEGGGPGFSEGLLNLGVKALLFAPELSAAKYPDLAQAVTIVARLRIARPAAPTSAFLLGLTDLPRPGDWKNMALGLLCQARDDNTIWASPFAILADGTTLAVGPSRVLPLKVGEENAVGISFDGTGPGTLTLWANGAAAVSRKEGAGSSARLEPFTGFALGHLKATGSLAVSFREIRIYSVALSPEWIEEAAALP